MTYQSDIELPEDQAPASLSVSGPKRSLIWTVSLQLLACACLGTLIAATIAFTYANDHTEEQAVEALLDRVERQGKAESELFQRARQNLETFEDRFLKLYSDASVLPDPDFDSYFTDPGDGTLRIAKRFFTGVRDEKGIPHAGVSGFIARNRPALTAELQRRLVLASHIVAEFGPGWTGDFANVHASLPENALIIYSPDSPWGLDAASDLDMTAGSVIQSTLPQNNPDRTPQWTALYYDQTAHQWTVTYQRPVDLQGKHLINPSLDIALSDLIARVTAYQPNGGYNMILSEDGMVVAHPEGMDRLQQELGQISVEEFGDPTLTAIYETLSQSTPYQPGQARVIDGDKVDAYLGVVRLDGPKWWLVSVYPHELVTSTAKQSALVLIALITASLIALIVMVLFVLRRGVARPIHQMTLASEHLSKGEYDSVSTGEVPLPVERRDEIGLLAGSFRQMAGRIGNANRILERTVLDRTIELELANQRLEELSLRDALTGAFNRRAFDRDLAAAMAENQSGSAPTVLALFDVDYFKRYNDYYGHGAGDRTLHAIVEAISAALPQGDVYRYGGEEIATILHGLSAQSALAAVQEAARKVASLGIEHAKSPFKTVTVSAGITQLNNADGEPDEPIQRADAALYAAKDKGRNGVLCYSDLLDAASRLQG